MPQPGLRGNEGRAPEQYEAERREAGQGRSPSPKARSRRIPREAPLFSARNHYLSVNLAQNPL